MFVRQDVGQVRRQLIESVVPYLNAARQIVADSCQLVIIFVCVLVLVDLLSAVVWIYLRRSVFTNCVLMNGTTASPYAIKLVTSVTLGVPPKTLRRELAENARYRVTSKNNFKSRMLTEQKPKT